MAGAGLEGKTPAKPQRHGAGYHDDGWAAFGPRRPLQGHCSRARIRRVLHELSVAQGTRAGCEPARRRRDALGSSASAGACRRTHRQSAGLGQRRLLRLARTREPHRGMGEQAERALASNVRPCSMQWRPREIASEARRCRVRRIGAATDCGLKQWNCGWRETARIHDRARWTRTLTPNAHGEFEVGPWQSHSPAALTHACVEIHPNHRASAGARRRSRARHGSIA